jgi:hypothetical protein
VSSEDPLQALFSFSCAMTFRLVQIEVLFQCSNSHHETVRGGKTELSPSEEACSHISRKARPSEYVVAQLAASLAVRCMSAACTSQLGERSFILEATHFIWYLVRTFRFSYVMEDHILCEHLWGDRGGSDPAAVRTGTVSAISDLQTTGGRAAAFLSQRFCTARRFGDVFFFFFFSF